MRKYLFSLLFSACISPLLSAAQSLDIEIKPDGSDHSIEFNSTSAATPKVRFWFVSSGNISTILTATYAAPANAVLKLQSFALGKKTAAEILATSATGWSNLKLTNSKGKDRATYSFPPTASAATMSAAITVPQINCSAITQDIVNTILAGLRAKGIMITQAELCGTTSPGANPGNVGNEDNSSTPYFRTLLSKDTCTGNKSTRTLVVVEFDLSKVDPLVLQAGVKVSADLNERRYNGSMAASIKPISDGRFAPKPLILMAAVGGGAYSNDGLYLAKWNRNKLRSRKKLKYAKTLYYRGLILSSALVDGVLTGGKGTFEITNGMDIYSVCFRLVRTRQKVNGYPG